MLKTWLKEFWWWLTDERFSILLCAIFYSLMLLFTRFMVYITGWAADKEIDFWRSLVLVEEPEICALCEDRQYYAPCLVNLATGQVGELQIYAGSGHGWTSFFFVAGASGMCEENSHTCTATLPEEMGRIDGTHFCRDCRAKLTEVATEGYVLADMYNMENFALYPVIAGEEYVIREYTVTVTAEEKSERLTVHVTGNT